MSSGEAPEMDSRSWLWKRKSSAKSPGETESSGSASTHSERDSDELEELKSSPNHAQSPEVSSNISPSHAQSPEGSSNFVHNHAQTSDPSSDDLPNHDQLPEALSNDYPNHSQLPKISSEVYPNSARSQSPEVSSNGSLNHAQSPEISSDASPTGADSPEVLSKVLCCEHDDTIKNLTNKLSAALSKIRAQEDSVKQHAKVAEEAVSGWEKAEVEASNMKQQLETAAKKSLVLENRITQLDGALKVCVKQLRQARDEQQQKIHDAVTGKANEWDTEKFELESRIVELESQLDDANAKISSANCDFQMKLDALDRENTSLKHELLSQSEQLRVRTLERELSIQAAEAASKQHLESIKKMSKLEAECRRLRASNRKTQSHVKTAYVESLTDSQSDSGERMQSVDNDPSCSDSWASALIAELDQFKNEKSPGKDMSTSSVEIDLMDDFLEMESLAALHPEANQSSSPFNELRPDSDRIGTISSPSKTELEVALQRTIILEEKVGRMESEKRELEILLACTKENLETASVQLKESEVRLLELQRQLESARASKHVSEIAVEASEAKASALQTQLGVANSKLQQLHDSVNLLEGKAEKEKKLAEEYARNCQKVEGELSRSGSKIQKLHEKVRLLEGKVDEERLLAKELALKCQSLKEKLLNSNNKHQELRENMSLLGKKAAEKKVAAEEVSVKCQSLENKLSSKNLELQQLHEKMSLLEAKVEEEKDLAHKSAMTCQKLEIELSRRKQEAELQRAANSNGDMKIKQERELVVAAGKLAECQQTIASLGRQLKSLANIDDLLFEAEMQDDRKTSSL